MGSPWTKFTRLREEVRSLIYDAIRERRQLLHDSGSTQTQKTDILTLLLQSRDKQGEAMTDEELHDELVTLLLAGHETTAFGGGHQRCISSALAMMELKLSVARLLQDFELALIRPRRLRPARRGSTMVPSASIQFKVRSKRD